MLGPAKNFAILEFDNDERSGVLTGQHFNDGNRCVLRCVGLNAIIEQVRDDALADGSCAERRVFSPAAPA